MARYTVQDPVAEAGEVGFSERGTVRGAQYASRSHPGASWRKSSWSAYNGACLEVAELDAGQIGVRDSKAGENGSVLVFGRADWAGFVAQLKADPAR